MNMPPEMTPDGTPPNGEEKKFDLVAPEPLPVETTPVKAEEVSQKEQERRYASAVRRVLKPASTNPRAPVDRFSLAVIRSKSNIARLIATDIAGVQMVDLMTIQEKLERAINVGDEIVSDANLNPEIRIKGIGMIAGASKVAGDLSEQVMKLADRAAAKGKNGNAPQRKNLPPSTGLEVSIGQGESKVSVRAAATNGAES